MDSLITYVRQPTRRSCGQTVCAMLAGVPPEMVIAEIGNRGTSGQDLVRWLRSRGFTLPDRPARFRFDREVDPRPGLPPVAIVRIDWATDRRRTHWILWAEGRFWDPDPLPVDGVDDQFAWLARSGRIYSILPVEAPRG